MMIEKNAYSNMIMSHLMACLPRKAQKKSSEPFLERTTSKIMTKSRNQTSIQYTNPRNEEVMSFQLEDFFSGFQGVFFPIQIRGDL